MQEKTKNSNYELSQLVIKTLEEINERIKYLRSFSEPEETPQYLTRLKIKADSTGNGLIGLLSEEKQDEGRIKELFEFFKIDSSVVLGAILLEERENTEETKLPEEALSPEILHEQLEKLRQILSEEHSTEIIYTAKFMREMIGEFMTKRLQMPQDSNPKTRKEIKGEKRFLEWMIQNTKRFLQRFPNEISKPETLFEPDEFGTIRHHPYESAPKKKR